MTELYGMSVSTCDWLPAGDPQCDHRFSPPVRVGGQVWSKCHKCGQFMGLVPNGKIPPIADQKGQNDTERE